MFQLPSCRVLIAAAPRVLLPPGADAPTTPGLAWRRSRAVQGADLDGPWALRVAVRLPLKAGPGAAVVLGARWLGAVHVRWLRHMGLRSASAYVGPARPAWAAFCARAPGDVVVGTRKVCSLSEVFSSSHVLLVACTLLQPPPWNMLGPALGVSRRELRELDECSLAASMLLGPRVQPQEWADSLRSQLLPLLDASQASSDA